MCDTVSKVKVSLHGVPGKIAAGSTVQFSMKVTNASKRTLDEVAPFAAAIAQDKTASAKDISHLLRLQWSNGSSWKNVGPELTAGTINGLKARRLQGRQAAPHRQRQGAGPGMGVAVAAGGYYNEDGTCGVTPKGSDEGLRDRRGRAPRSATSPRRRASRCRCRWAGRPPRR